MPRTSSPRTRRLSTIAFTSSNSSAPRSEFAWQASATSATAASSQPPSGDRGAPPSAALRAVRVPSARAVLVELLVEMEALEYELDGRGHEARALEGAELRHGLAEPGDLADALEVLLGAHAVGDLHAPARLEVLGHLLQPLDLQVLVPHLEHGAVDEPIDQVVLALVLAHVLELDLAGGGGEDGVEVGQARHDLALAQADGALLGVGEQALVVVDGDAHAHARGLVDLVRAARLEGQVRDDLLHEVGNAHRRRLALEDRHLLLHDRDLVLDRARVVGADLDVEAVLQRGDDAPAAGVVLRVRARDDDDVHRQADLVAFDLDVLLLHQVEEADLDLLGQVGKLVDGEQAAVRARDQAVVDGLLVGQVAALGHLDRVDLAHQVGHRDVGGGELLAVALVGPDPREREPLALGGQAPLALAADGRERVVVDRAARDHRHERVEERGQAADDAALRLPALAQEHDVVPGEHGVLDLGDDRVVVADDAGEDALAPPHAPEEVLPHLLADREHPVSSRPELPQRSRPSGIGHKQVPRSREVRGIIRTAARTAQSTRSCEPI